MANFGMVWVQSAANNLQDDLTSIYEGVTGNAYKACNRAHSYQKDWGQSSDDSNGFGEEWQYLLQKANAAAGTGNMKCLVGDLTQDDSGQGGWYVDGNNNVDTTRLNALVDYICQQTTADERSAILGWYLADEPNVHEIPNLDAYSTVVDTVHQRQQRVENGEQNWPFYVVFYIDGMWEPNHQELDLQQYMDPWVNAVDCAGGDMVIMLDYYPWASSANDFAYSESPAAKWHPLKRWKKFIDDVKNRYSKPVDVVLQAHHYGVCSTKLPGHADMHQQIRAMLNYTNVHDIWFWGWGPHSVGASARWTQNNTEKYAEAIERERNTASESLSKPNQNELYQNYPNPFSTGTWIPYALKERKTVSFVIKTQGGQTVRNIDLGYNYNSVEGWYKNNPDNQIDKLYGTAAYWDGKNNNGEDVAAGSYYCTMYVDSTVVDTITITKG